MNVIPDPRNSFPIDDIQCITKSGQREMAAMTATLLSHSTKDGTHNNCQPAFSRRCRADSDCCPPDPRTGNTKLFCDKKQRQKVGSCMPYTALTIVNSDNERIQCFENWYDYCTKSEQCCSGLCYRGKFATRKWEYGFCVPDIRILPSNKNFSNRVPTRSRNHQRLAGTGRPKRSLAPGKLVVCYLGSWANYKPGEGKFVIEDIDPTLCTHIVYGFAKLEAGKIAPFDPWLDLNNETTGGSLDAYSRFTKLSEKNPSLQSLIAIGGWNEGSEKYSAMASSSASREVFVESVAEFLQKYHFDGFDLDWEYPTTRGGRPEDKENLNLLLQSLRTKLNEHGKLLTMAVSANPRTVESGYDVDKISNLVDYISLMSYDYHGAFDNVTGHNAPLYAREDDLDLTFNVAYGVMTWLSKGVPPEKLILGLPLYGRAVTLKNPEENTILSPITGEGEGGEYSAEPGVLYYREICQRLAGGSWIAKWDAVSMAPYMYSGNQWVGFDNEISLALKVSFAMEHGLGGIMFWSLEADDFQDKCGNGAYSLLKSAKHYILHLQNVQQQPIDEDRKQKEQEEEEKEEENSDCSESSVDGIAFVSQLKSLGEWLSGKADCAKKTQEGFIRKAPLISQATSAIQAATGDEEGARQTQITFAKNMLENIEHTPVLGHVVAAGYCLADDIDRCKKTAEAASRPVAVVAGGVAGFALGGPGGAVAGGIAGGAVFDGITTGIHSAEEGKFSPQGTWQTVPGMFDGSNNPSQNFDTLFGIAGDALGGSAGGQLIRAKPGIKADKKDEKTSNSARDAPSKLCRRRRAGGGGGSSGCNIRFFSDEETFGHVPNLRLRTINTDQRTEGPIRTVQTRPVGTNGLERVEFVDAEVWDRHLKKGTVTVPGTRDFSKDMDNSRPAPHTFEDQDAGHIVARKLGGPGDEVYNIFPQSKHFNTGAWQKVEDTVYKEVQRTGKARYTIKLIYDDPQATRPSSIRYRIVADDDDMSNPKHPIQGDLDNPEILKADLSFLRKHT